jgi:hypothetical protein
MSWKHLLIRLKPGGCEISDQNSTNGTTVNGDPVTTAFVGPGDLFQCGQTVFSVDGPELRVPAASETAVPAHVELSTTQPVATSSELPQRSRSAAATPLPTVVAPPRTGLSALLKPDRGFSAATAIEILRRYRLRQSIPMTPEPDELPEPFVQRLLGLRDGRAALEFLSFGMHRRPAVAWLLEVIRLLPESDDDADTVRLSGQWIIHPDESRRRALMEAGRLVDPGRAAHWLAMAAFYSDGSIAPASAPYVAADLRVCGQAVLAGITLVSLEGPGTELDARRRELVRIGLEITRQGIADR